MRGLINLQLNRCVTKGPYAHSINEYSPNDSICFKEGIYNKNILAWTNHAQWRMWYIMVSLQCIRSIYSCHEEYCFTLLWLQHGFNERYHEQEVQLYVLSLLTLHFNWWKRIIIAFFKRHSLRKWSTLHYDDVILLYMENVGYCDLWGNANSQTHCVLKKRIISVVFNIEYVAKSESRCQTYIFSGRKASKTPSII